MKVSSSSSLVHHETVTKGLHVFYLHGLFGRYTDLSHLKLKVQDCLNKLNPANQQKLVFSHELVPLPYHSVRSEKKSIQNEQYQQISSHPIKTQQEYPKIRKKKKGLLSFYLKSIDNSIRNAKKKNKKLNDEHKTSEEMVLIGYSLGGMLACHYAAMFQDDKKRNIKGIILLDVLPPNQKKFNPLFHVHNDLFFRVILRSMPFIAALDLLTKCMLFWKIKPLPSKKTVYMM